MMENQNSALRERDERIAELKEVLNKSVILGMDVGTPPVLHKSGGTIESMFSEDTEAHNARIDAVWSNEGEET